MHQLVNYAQNNRPLRLTVAGRGRVSTEITSSPPERAKLFWTASVVRCTWPLNCWTGELCLVHCWHYGRASSRGFAVRGPRHPLSSHPILSVCNSRESRFMPLHLMSHVRQRSPNRPLPILPRDAVAWFFPAHPPHPVCACPLSDCCPEELSPSKSIALVTIQSAI